MRKFLFISLLFLTSFVYSQTPRAGGINNSQASILNIIHDNFIGIQPTNLNAMAVYSFPTTFDYNLGLKTTDNIAEGITNKYFTNTLARNAFAAGTGLTYLNGLFSLDVSTQSILSSVSSKFNNPTGTGLQYLNGLGIPVLFPTIPSNVNLIAGNRISITGTYPNLTISYIEPTINQITTKTLNSNYTISTTKQASVSYSLTCTVTNPLIAGSSTANVYLEYSINNGTTWSIPSQNGNSSAVGLAVAIAITNGQTVTVTGSIPANAITRLRTTTTGTATVIFVTGTEIY